MDKNSTTNRKHHGIFKMIQVVLKMLIMVIFTGYIMIWIMMPTDTFWLHWLPTIHSKLDSTYLGKQGANVLVYTVPILLIAVLSCLYLHLEKYLDSYGQSSVKFLPFASWRRLALVKSPLGIVSWTELAFLAMFITLLIWSFSSYLHEIFKNITRESAAQMGDNIWEAKLQSSALMLGLLGNICLAFLFIPVTRGSSIMQIIGLTAESSIKYHIWLGTTTTLLFTAHGLCYIAYWINKNNISEMLKWNKVGVSNLAGVITLICGLVMGATSCNKIRRKFFELFFYTHHLYIIFVVMYVLHVGFTYTCIILPGIYLFLIDRYLRLLQGQQRVRLVSARVLPCNAVELNFSKHSELCYSPTSMMFINLPSISKLQWHPFTITSSCKMDSDVLSVLIKSEGRWSSELYKKLLSPSPPDRLLVSIEGPYGPASNDFLRHDMLVMVSGGSGITPFISIIRELIFISDTANCRIPKILLVAAFQRSVDLSLLDCLLPLTGTSCNISGMQLEIQAYVTREKEAVTAGLDLDQTSICFKPNLSDRSAFQVLGPNYRLWLMVLIASSFLTFLLLIGILNRCYIYPIDHNSELIYSSSLRSILNLSFLCVSIVVTVTIGFLWNKTRSTREGMQIFSPDSPTLMTTSPGSHNNLDIELESPPNYSLSHVTTTYYGEKPNLERIISQCGGPNTKVLVSGPKKMREEVAAICSSSLRHNQLDFESISFSW
ncbi:hypothetical protein Leryth_007994 [Lithospermum erythrorhizon]|uniref:Oxidase n=1 Tax=Lithospermum erythrorhizon TaxID=34254 RepID=A0AAV3P0J2_LITER|nr:hypothetical protein Leryth_007994 [Lithospermum erythrorhizon]